MRAPSFHDFPSLLSEEEDAVWRESYCSERLLSGPVFFYGGPQLSRQNQKPHGKNKIPHGKTENLTGKPKTSQQNRKPHGKTKYREVVCFCREVFGFAVMF